MTGQYIDLQNRIADELGARTDLSSQIILAIQTAIAKWERQPFYFNEVYNTALLTTVASQEFYGGPGTEIPPTTTRALVAGGASSATLANSGNIAVGTSFLFALDNGDLYQVSASAIAGSVVTFSPAIPGPRSVPSGNQVAIISNAATLKFNLAKIDKLHVLVTSNRYPLTVRTWQYLDDVSVNPAVIGLPVDYSYFAGQLRIYPIPDGAYPITVSGIQRLTALVANSDSNAWTLDAEALIRAEAKADIFENVIQEPALADRQRALIYGNPALGDQGYLYALKRETAVRRKASIRPSYF